MSAQQHPGHCASQPSSPNQPHSIEPPFTRPSRQEKLLLASAAPICIHGFTFPSQPSTLNQTTMHHRETLAIKKTPFQRQAGIVSRMYSSHIPGCQVHRDDVNVFASQGAEQNRVINTTPDFISQLFSETRKPLIIDEKFYTAFFLFQERVYPSHHFYSQRCATLFMIT